MYAVVQDLRFAFRQVRKSPGFTLTVVVTLALGIGATTAVFSLIEGILLRPLPFAIPNDWCCWEITLETARDSGECPGYSGIRQWSERVFLDGRLYWNQLRIIGWAFSGRDPAAPDELQRVYYARRSTGSRAHFHEAGRGRELQVAVIGDALWQNRYHRDPHVLGSAIELESKDILDHRGDAAELRISLGHGKVESVAVMGALSLTPEELSDQSAGLFGYQWSPASRMA